MDVKKWYLKKSYIPTLGTEEFATFAANGYGLLKVTAGSKFSTDVKYSVDVTSPTAYFAIDSNEIAIPGWYLSPAALEAAKIESNSENAIVLINGSTIHEALHLVHTTNSMERTVGIAKSVCGYADENLVTSVCNITEDLYIEAHAPKTLAPWLAGKNDLLFPETKFDEVAANADPSNPSTMVDVMVFAKRISLRARVAEILNPQIVKYLGDLVSGRKTACYERGIIAGHIVTLLLNDAEEAASEPETGESDGSESDGSESETSESETGESEGSETGESKGSEGSEDGLTSSTTKYSKDPGEGAFGKETVDAILTAIDEDHSSVHAAAAAFNAAVRSERREEIEGTLNEKASAKYDHLGKRVVRQSVIAYEGGEVFNPGMTGRFASKLKQLRTVTKAEGLPKKTGSKIDPLRMHNAAVDGKIFSRKSSVDVGRNGDIEIRILVDASGSMNQYSTISGVSLYEYTIAVSKKLFTACRNSGVSTKVLAHTTIDVDDKPLLVTIADDETRNIEGNFSKALGIHLQQNIDGVIINEVATKEFSKETRMRKVLIVLSDGVPMSPNYSGSDAVKHTKAAIENARKNGIEVMSVSLVRRVNEQNDGIYGKENNFDASENLDDGMMELVTKLVRRR